MYIGPNSTTYVKVSTNRINLGRRGEDWAVEYLQKQEYQILERNFRMRWGEIDIVAREREFLVFIEVKTRWSSKFGLPEEAVSPQKLKQIRKMAEFYQVFHSKTSDLMRVDVIAIEMNYSGKILSLRHLKNVI